MTILAVVLYLPLLVFGTHAIRTWAFGRHEAVTFECSAVTTLTAVFLIWHYGPSGQRLLLCSTLLAMFIANAFTQWFFYMRLQEKIRKAFSTRTEYIKKYLNKNSADSDKKDNISVIDSLQTMASVAIMPSFSRFIEESKYFNNPGNLIGLIKSIMKRQRFQKKKYLMRDCFAEILNLIAPCKPDISKMMADTSVVPGTIQANDLALDKSEEITGLVTYDVLGFGAHITVFLVLLRIALRGTEFVSVPLSSLQKTVLMALSALLFTAVSRVLRHFGFARYESFSYELSFTTLVIASFRVLAMMLDGQTAAGYPLLILGASAAVFLFMSWRNKHVDKQLHEKTNACFGEVIDKITFDTETDRIKRRILRDLDTISDWTVVPYTGAGKQSSYDQTSDFSYSLSNFEAINGRKEIMPALTADFVNKVVSPDHPAVSEDDFKLEPAEMKKAVTLNDIVASVSFIALFILIGYGWV